MVFSSRNLFSHTHPQSKLVLDLPCRVWVPGVTFWAPPQFPSKHQGRNSSWSGEAGSSCSPAACGQPLLQAPLMGLEGGLGLNRGCFLIPWLTSGMIPCLKKSAKSTSTAAPKQVPVHTASMEAGRTELFRGLVGTMEPEFQEARHMM